MAGTLNVDTLKADSNLKLQIASANVAFIDANGLTIVGNSLNVGGGRIVVTSNNSISTPSVIGANLVTATGTTALGITANGQITTANAPFILTGGQLQFPATQIASGDGNCLDDYEEGTWTPSVGGNATYTNQYGIYVKVGRMVYAAFDFTINVIGTGSTSTLSGFPFTTTGAGFPYTGSTSYWASLTTNLVYLGFYMQNAATTALFVGNSATSGTTIQYNSFGVLGNSARIVGSVVYESAA